MANTFVTPSIIAKEAIKELINECVSLRLVHRAHESDFKKTYNGYKPGETISVKAPVYFRVRSGLTFSAVDLREEDVSITINDGYGVDYQLGARELTLEAASERYIKPAMQAIAEHLDRDIFGHYKYIPNQVGTPGTTPSKLSTYFDAWALLSEHAVPVTNRNLVIDPRAKAKIQGQYQALASDDLVKSAVQKAQVGNVAGFDTYESNNLSRHVVGTWAGGTILVNGAVSDGDSTIGVDGGTEALTIKAGDIFTIANVNAVNPGSGVSTGQLRQFVATEDVTFTDLGGGNYGDAAFTCIPGDAPWTIYGPDASSKYLPYQNVSALPANDAAVTVAGAPGASGPVGLAFHKNAIALVMVPIEVGPAYSKAESHVESYKGVTIRVTQYKHGDTLSQKIRFDVLYGIKVLNPFMACRIAG